MPMFFSMAPRTVWTKSAAGIDISSTFFRYYSSFYCVTIESLRISTIGRKPLSWMNSNSCVLKSSPRTERRLAEEPFRIHGNALFRDCIRVEVPVMLAFSHLLNFQCRNDSSPCNMGIMQHDNSMAQVFLRGNLPCCKSGANLLSDFACDKTGRSHADQSIQQVDDRRSSFMRFRELKRKRRNWINHDSRCPRHPNIASDNSAQRLNRKGGASNPDVLVWFTIPAGL